MEPERVVLSQEMLASAVGDRWSAAAVSAVAGLLADGEGKFPAGVKTVPPELVRAVQRERLLVAMLRAVAELGYREVNVQHTLDRSGVSRATFYVHFENKEDCFLAAYDAAAQRLRERLTTVGEGDAPWRERLRMGLEELLGFIADEPDAAKTLIVEVRASSPEGLQRRDDLLREFADCIDAGMRRELDEPPSEIAADGIVGGIESVLHARLNRGETDGLDALLPSLLYFAMLPLENRSRRAGELDDIAAA